MMGTILIIVLVILLLGGFGGYHGYNRYGNRGLGGVLAWCWSLLSCFGSLVASAAYISDPTAADQQVEPAWCVSAVAGFKPRRQSLGESSWNVIAHRGFITGALIFK
jgi:hypothetical protein